MCENPTLFLFLGVISNFGTDAVSAYIIGTRVINFSLIPGFGFQVAAATHVGQPLGAGQPENAERSGWRATGGAIASMSALGVGIAVFARPIAGWFDAAGGPVTDLAVTFLYIVCAAQPLMAFEFGADDGESAFILKPVHGAVCEETAFADGVSKVSMSADQFCIDRRGVRDGWPDVLCGAPDAVWRDRRVHDRDQPFRVVGGARAGHPFAARLRIRLLLTGGAKLPLQRKMTCRFPGC